MPVFRIRHGATVTADEVNERAGIQSSRTIHSTSTECRNGALHGGAALLVDINGPVMPSGPPRRDRPISMATRLEKILIEDTQIDLLETSCDHAIQTSANRP